MTKSNVSLRAGIAATLFAASMVCGAATEAKSVSDTRVEIADGALQGFIADGVAEFRGIPYAAPPVGNLRWRPPATPQAWKGVRDATQFGNICLQITTLGPFAGPANANEDCLFLNVYTPDTHPDPNELMPVIMWIHGGGNVDGGSNDYDGSKLATQGHVVVVTINYRLGLTGFLSHPAIDAENHLHSNYGLLDQQAAMKWIKKNIRKFGGDKDNVTIGGQSAGSLDSEANVISPLAKGLFQHAIFESVLNEPISLLTAEANGVAFAKAAGCGTGTDAAVAKCLRALSAEQIFKLSGTASTQAPYEGQYTVDGSVIPDFFVPAIENGHFNHVDIMSGWVEDEQNFSLGITEFFSGPPRVPASTVDYDNQIAAFGASTFPAGTETLAKTTYPLSNYATPQLALDAIGTDQIACAQRHHNQLYAPQTKTYVYEFDDRTAPSYFPKMPGFQPLAYHTSDIQYLFPGWHGGPAGIEHPLNAQQEFLADELVQAWTNFARTGNPNGQGNSPWPPFRDKPNEQAVLIENSPNLSTVSDTELSEKHKCIFWDSISTY